MGNYGILCVYDKEKNTTRKNPDCKKKNVLDIIRYFWYNINSNRKGETLWVK